MNFIAIKRITGLFITFIAISLSAKAQKGLPTVQESAVLAPANVKTDGKATEWNNQFQAYNKVTGLYYTIANDDNNLYLTVLAKDPVIIQKIVIGGLTLSVNTSGNHSLKNTMAITYPAYDKDNKPLFLILSNKPEPNKNDAVYRFQLDSFVTSRNTQLAQKLKLIQVTKDNADENISVYNEQGIKAASLFDKDLNYTLEMAIPLKNISSTPKDISKFSYNIKLNGELPKGAVVQNVGRPDIITFTGADGKDYMIGKATPDNLILTYATDAWGDYTLARK